MTKGIFGKKVGMTQIFDEEGNAIAVTVIEAPPCPIVGLRTPERDGYAAVRVGFGEVSASKVNKPDAGQFAKAGIKPVTKKVGEKERAVLPRYIRELKFDDCSKFEVGSALTVEQFQPGDRVAVTGISKGKGFAGAMKRHGFSGGPATHGSKAHRRPMSGGATDAARVFPGKKNPGRMGGVRVTVKGLRVVRVDPERNLILLHGAVPGPNGSYVQIRA